MIRLKLSLDFDIWQCQGTTRTLSAATILDSEYTIRLLSNFLKSILVTARQNLQYCKASGYPKMTVNLTEIPTYKIGPTHGSNLLRAGAL